jgi:DNA-binding response OmpR family regulator
MINILVVEDDIKLNQIVCTYLNDNGYSAKGCLNPNEAYDLMYNANYDLIISDIMMPGIDGFEFAKTVREINKTIPILFMTARDDFTSKQKGFQAGIDDYMVKPVNG